ncbi:MAG TPA: ABC transporter ATP-binding protein [Acidimicrobiia bacterium]|nr:ABC transporter ATP-binding protein [Acidimicrobiia bacterium]
MGKDTDDRCDATDGHAPVVSARDLTKRFGPVLALDAVDLEVHAGELLALLGPSGCGKTTALRLLAGFERPDRGTVVLDGATVAGERRFVPPERRRVGVVFQDFALFPHLTVAGNLGYGIPRDRSRRRRRVAEMLELIGLVDQADRHPHELSGGQQQRVALGRALAPEPAIVLLDEPFSNLDAALRVRMRSEVKAILDGAGATAVFVTHDQEEALSLADRIAVMRAGVVLQVDTPGELYAHPVDPFVASFVGDADLLPARFDGAVVDSPIGDLIAAPGASPGRVSAVLRPEQTRVWLDGQGLGTVGRIEYFGHDQLVTVDLPDALVVRARLGPGRVLVAGDRVSVAVAGEVLTFPDPTRDGALGRAAAAT